MARVIDATKKSVTIQAMLWDGSQAEAGLIIEWINNSTKPESGEYLEPTAVYKETNETVHKKHPEIRIHTLEGKMAANPGDWIIKGVKDEFYPCKPDIFDATYDYIK